jgi:hypothetical protein
MTPVTPTLTQKAFRSVWNVLQDWMESANQLLIRSGSFIPFVTNIWPICADKGLSD